MRWHLALALILLNCPARAAEPRLQDATITGSGGTISISQLPVRTSHGTVFRDVTINLTVDESGDVHLATVRPGASGTEQASPAIVQAPSPPPKPQHFQPGSYQGPDGSLMRLARGPGPDGAASWRFTALQAGSFTLEAATWQEGPIGGNPQARLIRRAHIASPDYSYGVSEGGSGAFVDGALLGAAQEGDTLDIVSFHHGCCTNLPKPSALWRFKLIGR